MRQKTKSILLGIVLTVSSGMHAQQSMKIGFKNLKEVFKKPNNCRYCSEAYHFVDAVKSIKTDSKRLESTKPKRKGKIQKRLFKKLEAFIRNANEEWQGLALELQRTESNSEANKRAITLKMNLNSIEETLYPPTFSLTDSIHIPLKRIKTLHKQITETLKN